MSLFREMYPLRVIESRSAFQGLEDMLVSAIERGLVREISVTRQLPEKQTYPHAPERWFLDTESGEVYSLSDPGERSCGYWDKVELEEIKGCSQELQ